MLVSENSHYTHFFNSFTPLLGTFVVLQYPLQTVQTQIRPQGYKTFFMLNSAEQEIYPACKC